MQHLEPNEPFYQISQAAKLLGITSDRLRTYEEEGLIKPYRTKHSKDGKRLFSPNDIEWLIMIRDLIKLGVSIPTIRILLIAKFPTNLSKLQEKDLEIIELLLKLKSHAVYSTIFYN
ncbi:MAG: MerR family transcriptional regulator [Romboutsia timonensis]|uniref:MerR family transcriptional regulator n=1 Tax=Romboutsia timonensis TaxID=1776391 RepID=UPI002A74C9C6|nr:MerR family transcriptional regulator [Romboutsia timonensis]MDY2881057.1 MerR family transcriptional regulator [Romboutsia timonensis]